ncbi:methionine biosynthesis protein MetW [Entomobacter blattae]|uniref:Methionine biosynthesis protein MetW n=1 Tax=Entomobacter blattae TaxID=2762277 RepID=A0A7H1NSQ8_9PROT|nr:methionine biosynthesis protein MetW [Entomobacter blattae]QNT78818.1 Methionine biosynthesis protein MetW [Entomobacter blattae]
MRADQKQIALMVERGSKVLEIGCAEGELLEYLQNMGCDARGVEISHERAITAVSRGLSVVQGDADSDLTSYPDHSFDYVILSRTLQTVKKPHLVLQNMLRIGRHVIVSFPNFGFWQIRLSLLKSGRMPMTALWATQWYETPNIHPFTILDFLSLSQAQGAHLEKGIVLDNAGRPYPFKGTGKIANLWGREGIFMLSALN